MLAIAAKKKKKKCGTRHHLSRNPQDADRGATEPGCGRHRPTAGRAGDARGDGALVSTVSEVVEGGEERQTYAIVEQAGLPRGSPRERLQPSAP